MSDDNEIASLVGDALQDLDQVDLRAEGHDAYAALFVDISLIEQFDKADWQILYGGPGTGKTFYLKALVERYRTFPGLGVLPVYLRMHDCLAPPQAERYDDYDVAHLSFDRFLNRLHALLVREKRALVRKQSLPRRLFGGAAASRDEVDQLLSRLADVIQKGVPVRRDAEYLVEDEDVREDRASRRMHGKAEVAAGKGVNIDAGLSGEQNVDRSRRSRSRREASGRVWPDYSQIRELVTDIAAGLNLRRIDVLIDDWSMLSISGGVVQAAFAQELKLALHGSSRISVKLASNWYQTTLSDRRYGLVEERDIFALANLDEPLLSLTHFKAFFEELLLKRLMLRHAELGAACIQRSTGRVDSGFLAAMFEADAFLTLLLGCDGVPRQVLLAVSRLAHDSPIPWSDATVRAAVDGVRAAQLRDAQQLSPGEKILIEAIKPIVTTTAQPVFLVPTDDTRAVAAVEQLCEDDLVVEKPSRLKDQALRRRYRAFEIRVETWRDWTRAMQYENPDGRVPRKPKVPWLEKLEDVDLLVLDGDALDGEEK